MSDPPHDPGVNPDDYDQEMVDAPPEDEAGGTTERRVDHHVPHGAPVPPFARCCRPKTRYQMELGSQLCGLISDAGIRPTHYRDIQVDDRLFQMWRGMPRDFFTLMRDVVGATSLVAWLRRAL